MLTCRKTAWLLCLHAGPFMMAQKELTSVQLLQCIETAKLRRAELMVLLKAQLQPD